MKNIFLFLFIFCSFFLNAQYPSAGTKIRLGWQTTGDGLVWRGSLSDTSTIDPSTVNNAWILIDTVSGTMYAYRQKAWRLVSGGGGGVSMPFDSVTFNINEGDASEQELKYSADKGYLQYGGLDSVQIPLLPGIWYVRNDTSVTIPKGTVVRASGTLGASGRIKVKHMIADGSIPAMYVLGIAMQDIAVGADGYVMTQGKIRQVNTTAYSEGAVLYADVDTLGGLTQTEPGNGYLKLPIAFVVHSASNGVLAVRIDAGSSLHDLHDVDTTGRVNGSVLRYDSALKYWKASTTAGIVAGDTAAMLTNYINVADTATMLSSYVSNADTSVFARDFQISGTSGQVTYFNGTNTVTGDANLTWSAANRTLGINTTTTSGANIIIKNTQEPVRDAAWLPNQTFGADTTNWTRGTGWTFNGTQAVATAATGALTYTTLPDTIISGRAYEVTYTLANYSAGTVTVAVGNATLALPAYNVTGNAVLLTPTSATGGFRFTTSTFTGNLDNVAVVEVSDLAPIIFAGQDDNTSTLYNVMRMPNSRTISMGNGGQSTTGVDNNFFGREAGLNTTTGTTNNFFGNQAGRANTTGSNNNFFGTEAGLVNTTGSNNNFFGTSAGRSNTTGGTNVFFGFQAGFSNTTGGSNFFFGNAAGRSTTTASNNIFMGNEAGRLNTTGASNVFIGNISGYGSATGSNNVFLGPVTGYNNRTGGSNVFIGNNTGYNITLADTLTGSNNTAIGANAATNIASTASGNLVLGNSVNLPTGNGSNQVVIKNLIFGTGASGTGTTIQTTAKAGINVNNPQSTLDVEGNMAIGATYSGTTAAPTNGLIVEGNTGIGTSSPQRRLHVTGTVRVDTLTRDVPTRVLGADADGDLAAVTLGTGLSIASGTLNGTDTTSLSNRINLKLNASDTTKYVKYADTATTIATKANVALKLNISDTSVFARDFQVSGSTWYLPRFKNSNSLENSVLYQSGNKMLMGTTSGNILSKNFEIRSATASDPFAQTSMDIYFGNPSTGIWTPYVQLYRSRDTTVTGFRKVENGDWLGRLTFQGADGAKYVRGAQMYALVDATTGLDSMSTALRFATNPGNLSEPADRMSITSAGRVGIATTSPSRTLHVNSTDALKLPAGTTAERPSVGITGDLRMNTSPAVDSLEYYNGTSWVTVQDKLQNPIVAADTSVFARDFQINGTGGYVPKFTTTSTISNSALYNPAGNKLMVGHTTANVFTNGLEIHSASNDAVAQPSIDVILGNTNFADYTPRFQLYRNRSTTLGAVTKVNQGDWLGRLMFNGADGAKYVTGAQIYAITDATIGLDSMPTAMRFATNGGTTSQPTDRMSITSAGRVGIATTSPSRTLHISATDAVRIPAGTNAQQTGGDAGDLRLNTDDSNLRFYDNTGWRAVMQSSNTVGRGTAGRVFYADADGRVAGDEPLYWDATNNRLGVNQATPIAPLDVNGGARITTVLEVPNIRNGTTANNVLTLAGNAAASGNAAGSENLAFNVGDNGATRAMTILNNGRVGIGTTSPDSTLHVSGGVYVSGVVNSFLGFESYGQVILRRSGSTIRDVSLISASNANNLGSLVVYPVSTGTNAGSALTVTPKGTGLSASQKTQITLHSTDAVADATNTSFVVFRATGSSYAFMNAKAGSGSIYPIFFNATGTQNQPDSANIYCAVDGKVGVRTSSPTAALHVNGSLSRNAPVTVTDATHTVAETTSWLICNRAGTITLTLPTASSWTGREIMVKTIQAQTVISNASNVVPLNGGAAGTAILTNTIGKWATLVSDGTNWIIMQAN